MGERKQVKYTVGLMVVSDMEENKRKEESECQRWNYILKGLLGTAQLKRSYMKKKMHAL